jgi:hypothetical protein
MVYDDCQFTCISDVYDNWTYVGQFTTYAYLPYVSFFDLYA